VGGSEIQVGHAAIVHVRQDFNGFFSLAVAPVEGRKLFFLGDLADAPQFGRAWFGALIATIPEAASNRLVVEPAPAQQVRDTPVIAIGHDIGRDMSLTGHDTILLCTG